MERECEISDSNACVSNILKGPRLSLMRLAWIVFPKNAHQHEDKAREYIECFNRKLCSFVILLFVFRWWMQRVNGSLEDFIDAIIHKRNKKQPKSYLVVAGQMSMRDEECNIAQLDLDLNEWKQWVQLSSYKMPSTVKVYSLVANPIKPGELIVVGAFDTTDHDSQVKYCSVGNWTGIELKKISEGLCNNAFAKGMKITSAAFAGPNHVFVAGSFHTQIWNGEDENIYNIAHYNRLKNKWLPLEVGQLTCDWCVVTVMAIVWDSKRGELHVAGKFNGIDDKNIPPGLATYNFNNGQLLAHPAGGLTMKNIKGDGVGTALQLDEENSVLYVMGSFERLSKTKERCMGLAAFEMEEKRWTCLIDPKFTVEPSGEGNMLLTPYGLMVAGKVSGDDTTWPYPEKPYAIALLKISSLQTTTKDAKTTKIGQPTGDGDKTEELLNSTIPITDSDANVLSQKFEWGWLPGFYGHDEAINCLSNGYNEHEGTVFIGGQNFVGKWYPENRASAVDNAEVYHDSFSKRILTTTTAASNVHDNSYDKSLRETAIETSTGISTARAMSKTKHPTNTFDFDGVTVMINSGNNIRHSIMTISQLVPPDTQNYPPFLVSFIALGILGACFGMIFLKKKEMKGMSLDTLTYGAVENASISEAYARAMRIRFVENPRVLTTIDPAEIVVHRIIGEGTFGRVWSANWRSSSVAVKEFIFAQAAVAGKSCMRGQIIDEIIGEAGMMSILRHPNILQLFGCCLTSQAIWIVSELCSMGSLRQVLDDTERDLPLEVKLQLALNVAEGMAYLHTQEPPILHRDLKSHNIFVHEMFSTQMAMNGINDCRNSRKRGAYSKSFSIVAKIGDWGSARAALAGSRTMTHGVGTACWLAPEVIKHARSSKSSDVFGFGIILWELATREEVYKELETTQIILGVANNNLRPKVPEDCDWKDLMVQCWHKTPDERPNFEAIVVELNEMLSKSELGSNSGCSPEIHQESYQRKTLQ